MGGGGEVAFGWHDEFRGWRAVGWKGGFGLFGLLGGKVVVCGELWTLDQEGFLSCGASLLSVRGGFSLMSHCLRLHYNLLFSFNYGIEVFLV